MATELDPNQQTIEQALSNILGHTKDIANLLRAKEAAELALRGGGGSSFTEEATKDLFKASGLDARHFTSGYEGIVKKLKSSVTVTQATVNSYNKALKDAVISTKGISKAFKDSSRAINYQYSIGRGKFVVPTPFQAQRSRIGGWADLLLDASTRNSKLKPGTLSRLKELSMDSKVPFDKILRRMGSLGAIPKAALQIGRVASGASSLGWFGAAGVGAVGAIGAQIAKSVGDALKTTLGGTALSMGLQARGAYEWTTGTTTASIYGLRRMGLNTDAAMQAITQGQAMGLGSGEIRSAVAAQQALGITNALQKVQTLTRRMNWQNDAASYFRSLEPIMQQTKLSMEELSNATEEFASNLRGAMDSDTIRGLMGRFGDLVRTKAISWGEVANIAMTPQALAPNQQMAFAHFAAKGGYQFKHSTLLGQAYELQRMGPQQMGNSLKAMRAYIRGITGQSWGSLSDEDKYKWANLVLQKQGIADFYKFPQGEEIMQRLLSGTYSETDKRKWEEAMKGDTTRIAESMHLIQEPLTSINTMLAGWISNLGVGKVGDFAMSAAQKVVDATQSQTVNLNVQATSNVRDVDVVIETAGKQAIIRSGANK